MKIVEVLKLVWLLLCLKILLALSLSLSFHEYHSLFDLKVIYMAKSNKLVMFLAFNFILIATLLGNHEQPTGDSDITLFLVPSQRIGEKVNYEDTHKKNESLIRFECVEFVDEDIEDGKYDALSEVGSDDFHGYDGYDEDNDDDHDDDDIYSEDEDDFKKRIEEFIAKNIKEWEDEQLIENMLVCF